MNPLVSVVVPIYNVEAYLDRCISSVVLQTYSNLEIILVDDGSPDRCPQICDDWARRDCRIKVIHKENAGLGMARNTGIEHATGSYVYFLDSDDYMSLRRLKRRCAAPGSILLRWFYLEENGSTRIRKFFRWRSPTPGKWFIGAEKFGNSCFLM